MAFRDSPWQSIRAVLGWAAVAVMLIGIIGALALLFTDRRTATTGSSYGATRSDFDELIEPVANVVSAPARWIGAGIDYGGGYFFAVSENRALKQRLVDMQHWQDQAIALKDLNRRYEQLLKLRTEPPIPMVSARVVADSHGPFSNARLADSGMAQGIKIGNPAMSEHGVIGRVVGATANVSRILLLTDVESRTPVLLERTDARAILTGDGGPNPRLDFVRGQNAVKDGDIVMTSGDGGLYPRGLPVGVAVRDLRGVWRVRLYADRAPIDVVRILLFDDFSQNADQAGLSADALPPMSAAEKAEVASEAAAATRPTLTAPATAGAAPPAAVSLAASVAKTPATKKPKAASKAPHELHFRRVHVETAPYSQGAG